MSVTIRSHRDLEIYKSAADAAMEQFSLSKAFPRDEVYSLTSQVRRSSRSVAANIVEAWRKRRYRAAFISKMSDAETEAAETQVWIEFAVRCEYLSKADGRRLYRAYERLVRQCVGMITYADRWLIKDARQHSDDEHP
jgi:four helix bundle protein